MVIYDPKNHKMNIHILRTRGMQCNAQIVMNCGIQIKNQNSKLVFKSRSL